MARKIQFEVTDEAENPLPQVIPAPQSEQASRAPSLSGMAKSLQAAAAAAIRDVDTRLIDDSQFKDRIHTDDDEVAELAESIRTQGQLIPILVSPTSNGRFRIVYGRRRLAALRHLGLPAKALVRELDENQAVIAQGQENSFRKDLSWIEKALFAKQLLDGGKSDELVCDALNIDQKARKQGEKLTGLSRMRQVTARLSVDLIEAIGPAPKTGRDRWYDLAQQLEKKEFPPGNQMDFVAEIRAAGARGVASDDRFALLASILLKQKQPARPRPDSGPKLQQTVTEWGAVKISPRSATITIESKGAADLHKWIANHPSEALKALRDAQQKSEQP
jgi:ParB family transcriptional regulator, chromosome partitioning protein